MLGIRKFESHTLEKETSERREVTGRKTHNVKVLVKMDFCCSILLLAFLLFCQFTINNSKTLSVNSHLLNRDSGNGEKFTIELARSNLEEQEETFDDPLKGEIARRFRRAVKITNKPSKTKVIFYHYIVTKFASSPP